MSLRQGATLAAAQADALLLIEEVADMLRTSERNVYSLVARRQLAGVHVGAGGRALRFRREDVANFVASRCTLRGRANDT